MATFVLVQAGTWNGAEADIYLDSRAAAAFFTAAHDYMVETHRPMPEIAEPVGGLRTVAQTTEMQWAFDYGPHGKFANSATDAQRAQSNALYVKYNMSRVSTARPSIDGTHTTGLYFDVATAAFLTWILDGNGRRYGITRPLTNDPNHCRVSPGTETVALNVAGLDNSTTIPEDLMSFKLGYVTDNNGKLYTLFDLVHGRYDQTRDQGTADLWDLLYMPPGVNAQDFGSPASNGSLAILLSGGGFVQQKWPWAPVGDQPGSVDLSSLVTKDELDTALAALPKPPTTFVAQ